MATHNLKDCVSMLENFMGAPMTDNVVSLAVQAHELRKAHAEMKVLFDGLTSDMLHLTNNVKARIDKIENDILVNIKPCLEKMENEDSVDVNDRLNEVEMETLTSSLRHLNNR
ncbi:Uncharacterized protein Adt_44965 [Abeliophyllum distichum]|uniref:Uncharacterized protein n=1 Tax=Abeliophyllum distichum TaxID=126358 RepID=A0ABD1PCF4_9LAMI